MATSQAVRDNIEQLSANQNFCKNRDRSMSVVIHVYEQFLEYARGMEGTPEDQRALARALLTAYFMPSEA